METGLPRQTLIGRENENSYLKTELSVCISEMAKWRQLLLKLHLGLNQRQTAATGHGRGDSRRS